MNTFDEIAENYDEELKASLGVFAGNDIDKFARYKIETLSFLVKNPKNILEFGCGTGRNIPFLTQIFPNTEIFACDASEKSIEAAKKIIPTNPDVKFAIIGGPQELADTYRNVDVIFVSGVFHHISFEEHEFYLEALNKILSQGGKIIIFEHNPYNPLTSRIFKKSRIDRGCKMLEPKYLKESLKRVNFCYLKIYYALFFLLRNKFFTFLEKKLSWCPLGGQYFITGVKK